MAQNIGIGVLQPVEKLDINGGIKLGQTDNAAGGIIRWNQQKSDFEGFNGTAWVSLTGGKGKWGSQQSFSTESSATVIHTYNPGAEFGNAVASTNDWAIIGAFRDEYSGGTPWDIGSIRIFKRTGDVWQYAFGVLSPTNNYSDFYGKSVGITSTHVIVGADQADLPNNANCGLAYIYSYNSNNITIQDTLIASDIQANDYFGSDVAIDGDFALVGAYGNDIGGVNNMGRAYLFKRLASQWPQQLQLTAPDGGEGDGFGYKVALKGSYLAVSAPFKVVNNQTNAGKVYVYNHNGISWSLIGQLVSPNVSWGEYFGRSLAIDGNTLVIGGPDYNANPSDSPGTVYIYSLMNSTVNFQSAITPSDGLPGDGYGSSVDILDDVILAGSPYSMVGAAERHGKVYVHRLVNGQWVEEAILTSSSNGTFDEFGTSVTLNQQFGIVGAPRADIDDYWVDHGQVYFFAR